MFVFQLWWMLKLKFCIPPSIQFEADLAAELDVTPPELEVTAELDVDVLPGVDQAALGGVLEKLFDPPPDPDARPGARPTGGSAAGAAATPSPTTRCVKLAVRNGYGSSADPAPSVLRSAVHVDRRGCGATRWCTRERAR